MRPNMGVEHLDIGNPEQGSGKSKENRSDVSIVDDILAVQQRRHLLYCLCTYASPMPLPSIADQLTIWEGEFDTDTEYLQRRLQIYDSLYYDHIPILSTAGLISYDQQDDMVMEGGAMEQARAAIEDRLSAEIKNLLQAERTTFEPDTRYP